MGLAQVSTGNQDARLPAWSPNGKWLAVTQRPRGVLLVMPDLADTRSLDTPSCFEVAWRPGH
jgi:Tol biopolymer transport system component